MQHHFLLLWFDSMTGCLLSFKNAYDLRAASLILWLSIGSEYESETWELGLGMSQVLG
jgi:hypothetical protein